MNVKLTWTGAVAFVGETDAGHRIVIDGPEENGGRNLGPRPMETLLIGMGACTAYDVVSILQKGRQQMDACQIAINSVRAEEHPKVFTEIQVHFTFSGTDLKPKQIERAIELSSEKYCSASIMLGKTAKITHSYEILD
ncbi:MAG: OsmC family protein [Gammaproteobacteria bacterium]